jgi:glycosyltransferase involved in cell wall biosynthesis
MAPVSGPQVSTLLLVRNSVEHDARVLRAARVAQRELDGASLVLGVATLPGSAGTTMIDGIRVVRLTSRPPSLVRLLPATGTAGIRRLRVLVSKPSTGHAAERTLGPGTVSPGPRLTPAARVRRGLSGLSFATQALSLARRVKPTVVHANDWNTMWCGLAIKLTCGSRLVYDTHELWADRNGRWEWRAWLVASEALFVRIADEVLTSSPGYADALANRYRIRRPVVVRNIPERPARSEDGAHIERTDMALGVPLKTYDPPDTPTRISREPAGTSAGPSSPARVIYVGGLMPGRGLEQMIDALPLIEDAYLCAVGPGGVSYSEGLLARAAAVGVADRVELRAPVAPEEVQSVLMGAAAGLCLIQPVCHSYELCLPNKLFEYAAAGVPILASDMPVIAQVVRSEGLGEVVAPSDPQAIAAGLNRLLQPERWKLVTQRMSSFAATHDWAGEAGALAAIYGRAAGELAA